MPYSFKATYYIREEEYDIDDWGDWIVIGYHWMEMYSETVYWTGYVVDTREERAGVEGLVGGLYHRFGEASEIGSGTYGSCGVFISRDTSGAVQGPRWEDLGTQYGFSLPDADAWAYPDFCLISDITYGE